MLDSADTSSLALLYHFNSEPWLNAELSEQGQEVDFKEMAGVGASVALPRPNNAHPLLELIRRRRSCRHFEPSSLMLTDLAEILAGTYALTRWVAVGGGLEVSARSVPSAGRLYPLELYVVLQSVETLADGLYHYNILAHALEPLRAGIDRAALGEAFLGAQLYENANAVIFITAVFDRTLSKYAARGYRYILLEAGHAAQNLCLLATERGLATLCVGGFMDAAINRFLSVEPQTEAAVYCVGVGRSR
jgi:SagB-type dehydrogenase family enzyme